MDGENDLVDDATKELEEEMGFVSDDDKKPDDDKKDDDDKDKDKDEEGKKKDEDGDDKEKKPEDDPEYDLGTVDDQPVKLKRSEILKLRKGGMLEADYTQKTQEISDIKKKYEDIALFAEKINSHDGLRKLIYGIAQKTGMDEDKINDAVVDKYLGILEEKKEEVKDTQEDIEKILQDLDPDGPEYKALKRQHEQNKKLQDKLDALETKISGFDTFKKTLTGKEQKEALDKATAESSEVLKTTLGDMADKEKNGFEFIHNSEKVHWGQTVQAILQKVKWPEGINQDAFKDAIKKAGKAAYDFILKEREADQAFYLKDKKKTKEEKKKTVNNTGMNISDLDESEQELLNEMNKEEP